MKISTKKARRHPGFEPQSRNLQSNTYASETPPNQLHNTKYYLYIIYIYYIIFFICLLYYSFYLLIYLIYIFYILYILLYYIYLLFYY